MGDVHYIPVSSCLQKAPEKIIQRDASKKRSKNGTEKYDLTGQVDFKLRGDLTYICSSRSVS